MMILGDATTIPERGGIAFFRDYYFWIHIHIMMSTATICKMPHYQVALASSEVNTLFRDKGRAD
jgi:hypothetical protein